MPKNYLKYFPFTIPLLKNLRLKKLSNIKLLQELPFYDKLIIVKNSNEFSGYARSYKVEVV